MKNYVKVILYIDSLSGNPHLEKWSATSLRRAGLCADHFSDNSFNKEGKKKLKRGSVPFPFKNNALPNSSNEDVEINNIPMVPGRGDRDRKCNRKCNRNKKEK